MDNSESLDTRKLAMLRRNFIVTEIGRAGRVDVEIVKRKFSAAQPAIVNDHAFFKELGLPYEIRKGAFVDTGRVYEDGLSERNDHHQYEKKLVAELAASFALGVEVGQTNRIRYQDNTSPFKVYSTDLISRQLSELAMAAEGWRAKGQGFDMELITGEVRKKWSSYLQARSRMLAIDSGTTNEEVAANLAVVKLPLHGSSLNHLTVATNSRKIFEKIGPKEVTIKTIIIGGQQRARSASISGALAEQFLRNTSILTFSMGIVGATAISLEQGYCYADSQEEAAMKGLFIDRSALKVVVADCSKIREANYERGYPFSSLDSKSINLIITNAPLLSESPNGSVESVSQLETSISFHKNIRDLVNKYGVPVIVATSDKTIKLDLFHFSHLDRKPV